MVVEGKLSLIERLRLFLLLLTMLYRANTLYLEERRIACACSYLHHYVRVGDLLFKGDCTHSESVIPILAIHRFYQRVHLKLPSLISSLREKETARDS
jgi:hypothetical protein